MHTVTKYRRNFAFNKLTDPENSILPFNYFFTYGYKQLVYHNIIKLANKIFYLKLLGTNFTSKNCVFTLNCFEMNEG